MSGAGTSIPGPVEDYIDIVRRFGMIWYSKKDIACGPVAQMARSPALQNTLNFLLLLQATVVLIRTKCF